MSMVQGNPHDGLVRWSKTEMGVRSKCGRFEIQNWRGKAKGVDKNSWVVLINGKNVISNKGTLMTWRRLRDAKGYCTAKAYYFNMGGK